MLSVVIPAFNEQEMVPAAAEQIDGILSRAGIPHELIFIDDGSPPFLPACRRQTATVSP